MSDAVDSVETELRLREELADLHRKCAGLLVELKRARQAIEFVERERDEARLLLGRAASFLAEWLAADLDSLEPAYEPVRALLADIGRLDLPREGV